MAELPCDFSYVTEEARAESAAEDRNCKNFSEETEDTDFGRGDFSIG